MLLSVSGEFSEIILSVFTGRGMEQSKTTVGRRIVQQGNEEMGICHHKYQELVEMQVCSVVLICYRW